MSRPSKNYSATGCSICFDKVEPGRDRKTLDCGHVLHKKCFVQLRNAGHWKCPNCRQPFEKPPLRKRCNPSTQTSLLDRLLGASLEQHSRQTTSSEDPSPLIVTTRRRSVLNDNDVLTSTRPDDNDPPKYTKIKKKYLDDDSDTEEEDSDDGDDRKYDAPDCGLTRARLPSKKRAPSPPRREASPSPTPPAPSSRGWNRALDDYDRFLENMTDGPFFRFMRSNVIHEARRGTTTRARKLSSDSTEDVPSYKRGKR